MMRIPPSKTTVPELPNGFVQRPRLWRRLAAAGDDQLVVVVAPPGYGKTLLLAEWVRHGSGPPTAWVSLDRDDADPRRLWTAILTAVTALPSVPPSSGLHRLRREALRTDGDDLTDDVVDDMLEALEVLRPPVRLILDDVHELGRHQAPALDRLVRRRPAGLHLTLASRSDPPLSLPRLRLDSELCELRAEHLRFSVQDAAALLRPSGLDPGAVAALHEKTEGWAAGLRLAGIALRRCEDHERFLTEFSGDDRSIADYLTGEVLSSLSADSRDVLGAASVCSRLPVALAVELAARSDAGQVLDQLAHETALIERTASGEYRIHALLRSYLAADLARHRGARCRERHVRAARWWAAHHEPVHALRHAERADDPAVVADLLRERGMRLVLDGELAPVRRALDLVERAGLPPDRALDEVRRGVELLSSGLPAGRSRAPDPRSPDVLEPEAEALRHADRAAAELDPRRAGDLALARVEAERALDLARAHGFGYLEVNGLTLLGLLRLIGGDLRASAAAAEEAVAAAARQGQHPSGWTARALFVLAYLDLLRGDPERARTRAAGALGVGESLPPGTTAVLHAVHGNALADLGEPARGLAQARAARRALDREHLPLPIATGIAVLEHRVALALGNDAAAAEVVTWLSACPGAQPEAAAPGEILLMRAWAEATAGRPEAASATVAPLHEPGARTLLGSTAVEVHLVDAEAALHTGDPPRGRAALDAALARAEAVDLLRPFAFAGVRTRELLRADLEEGFTNLTARRAVACTPVRPAATRSLSEREIVVLSLLPSLLNVPEMAHELVVSVNTVRTQVRSIYTKLGVSTRRQAVTRAHERGLL